MNTYDTATPYAASYLLLRQNGKVAFLLRSNTSWMNGYYSLPAGKVEKGESFVECMVREAQEEVGVTVQPASLRHVMTLHHLDSEQGSTWVAVFFEADQWDGTVTNAEPHKHGGLDWFDLNDMPDNIIPSVRFALQRIAGGQTYCEYGFEAPVKPETAAGSTTA